MIDDEDHHVFKILGAMLIAPHFLHKTKAEAADLAWDYAEAIINRARLAKEQQEAEDE